MEEFDTQEFLVRILGGIDGVIQGNTSEELSETIETYQKQIRFFKVLFKIFIKLSKKTHIIEKHPERVRREKNLK